MTDVKRSISLADLVGPLSASKAIEDAQRTGSATPLIDHLRADGHVTREMNTYLASVLAGEERLSLKVLRPHQSLHRTEVALLVKAYQAAFMGRVHLFGRVWEHEGNWTFMLERARAAGYDGSEQALERKGTARKVAELIVCNELKCSRDQLDAILHPRTRSRAGRVAKRPAGSHAGKN